MSDRTTDSTKHASRASNPAVSTKEEPKMKDQKKAATIVTASKEELAAIEKKAATRKHNRLALKAVKDSLAEMHKYACAKSKADLQKDYKLPDYLEGPEGPMDDAYFATDEGKAYSHITDQYIEAYSDHQLCIGDDIAKAVFALIDNQKCEKCGEHHAHTTNWARDRVLQSLLAGAAARLIESEDFGCYGKAEALEQVIVLATDAYTMYEGHDLVKDDPAYQSIVTSVALALPNHRKHVFINGDSGLIPTNLEVAA